MRDTPDTLAAFRHFRETINTAIHEAGNTSVNRFFARDARGYEDGAVALVVGGSIVIRHLRHAVARLGQLPAE